MAASCAARPGTNGGSCRGALPGGALLKCQCPGLSPGRVSNLGASRGLAPGAGLGIAWRERGGGWGFVAERRWETTPPSKKHPRRAEPRHLAFSSQLTQNPRHKSLRHFHGVTKTLATCFGLSSGFGFVKKATFSKIQTRAANKQRALLKGGPGNGLQEERQSNLPAMSGLLMHCIGAPALLSK